MRNGGDMTAVITEGGAAWRTPKAPHIPDLTLPEFVLGAAYKHGDKRALVDAATGQELSYAGLADAVREVGAGLSARGIRRGDVLALSTPNCVEFAVTWFAATSAGAIVTTVNPLCTEEEISGQLRQTGARWLVTTAGLAEQKLAAIVGGVAIAETFVIGEGVAGTSPFCSLRGIADAPAGPVAASDVALLPTSSGTTGLPKSVELTHRNLVASLCQTSLAHQVTEDDVVIAALPLFHIYGLQITLNLPLAAGATVVILPRFELAAFLQAMQDYGVTRAEVVPPMVLGLVTADITGDYDLSALRLITSAAAPLGTDLARACAARLGCRVKQAYGMTEVSGGTHISPDDGPDRPGSIGPALPGVECRIVAPGTGTDLGPGEPGELLVRTAATMRGYLADPQATAATIDADGCLRDRPGQGADQVQGVSGGAGRARGPPADSPGGRGRGGRPPA
jgi:acyl-CoA synthetase (AMP-forming)/AMP-acid ligase II